MMRLLAALTFFTRLPFWRIREIPAGQFKRVVPLWPVAGWITPVPGGVGPMTITMLLYNTVQSAKSRAQVEKK